MPVRGRYELVGKDLRQSCSKPAPASSTHSPPEQALHNHANNNPNPGRHQAVVGASRTESCSESCRTQATQQQHIRPCTSCQDQPRQSSVVGRANEGQGQDLKSNTDLNFNARLQEEIRLIRNRLEQSRRVSAKSKSAAIDELPPLPPLVDLLRATNVELIQNLVATHQELDRLRSLLTQREGGPTHSLTTLTVAGHRQCTIRSSIPFTADEDLHVESHFSLSAPTASQLVSSPSPELQSQILQDVLGTKRVTTTSLPEMHETISTTYVDYSGTGSCMVLNGKPGDGAETTGRDSNTYSDSFPLDPIETLAVNERTMKHMLLYINPRTAVDHHFSTRPCFDHSEMDLELQKLFSKMPPVSHALYLQPRKDGGSVPGVDSFYGTKDLKRFGHASYFMPGLSPNQRKILGWRASFRRGRRKYHSNLFRSTTDPCSLTFCEWIGKLGHDSPPSGSSCNSLEYADQGPRIFPLIRKQFCKHDSLLDEDSEGSLQDKRKHRLQLISHHLQKALNRLLPCWWDEPPPIEEAPEDWQLTARRTVRERVLRLMFGRCMAPDEGTSAHDIATSQAGSGVTCRPPPVLVPVAPSPKRGHHWFLPAPGADEGPLVRISSSLPSPQRASLVDRNNNVYRL